MKADKSTHFLPAERDPYFKVLAQNKILASQDMLAVIADSIPNMFLILNGKRQIVFMNSKIEEFAGNTEFESILGLRPGELLDCENACLSEGGCGTSKNCHLCGAAKSFLGTETGEKSINECRITTRKTGMALDLKITASPYLVENETFVIFIIEDISNLKRKQVMERLFFHDIMNTASGIYGLSDILRETAESKSKDLSEMLFKQSLNLVEEIQLQRDLVQAENGELRVVTEPIHTFEFLESIAELYAHHTIAQKKRILVDPLSLQKYFLSDSGLLRRVIGNMVKNALEAVDSGSVVTMNAIEENEAIIFNVQNQGVIPAGVQGEIFHRSFSTKGIGRGLGTFSIKLITEKYLGGQAFFRSDESFGTLFSVRIPLIPENKLNKVVGN